MEKEQKNLSGLQYFVSKKQKNFKECEEKFPKNKKTSKVENLSISSFKGYNEKKFTNHKH